MVKKITNLEELKNELVALNKESEAKKWAGYDKLELEKINYDAPSDDEIYNLAKSYVDQKYSKLAQNTKTENADKQKTLAETIKQAQQEYSAREKKRESDYEKSKNEVEDQALKRGLARSSIVLNELTDLETQKNAEINDSKNSFDEEINKINGEISDLGEKLNKSLKELDMQKAVELNEKIESLKSIRDQKSAEAIKYNNQIKEKESQKQNEVKLARVGQDNAIDTVFSKRKLSATMDYLETLSKKDALDLLDSDEDLKKALGDDYYVIYNAVKVRND